MIKKLLKKYKEQEERIMFHLKSKYTTEKIEKLEKMARKVCSFLIFLNMCTLMLNVQAFTKGIEEAIKKETSTLTVVLSDGEDNQDKTNESQVEIVKTENIDHFTQEVENLNENSSMERTKENPYTTKRLIVMANSAEFDSYEAKNVINFDNLYILQYETEEQTQSAYNRLKDSDKIESVEIDAVMEAERLAEGSEETKDTQEDTELKKYLDSLSATKEIKTAILDTGLNNSNLIEPNRIVDTKINLATTGEKDSIADDNGHGTEIAELIAKNSNNNVKIMPVKVANNQGKATILNVYLGIQKAIEKGANVINISMNTVVSSQSQILNKAISEASEQGILFIVSAGNDSEDVRNYTPSNIGSAIVVSAVEEDNRFASYSNYGQTVDYSTYGTYNGKTGTSYSAATVTGIMADLLSKNQEISGLDNYVIDMGETGWDPQFGKGFVGLQFKGTNDNNEENNNNNNENDNNGENTGNENDEDNKNEDEIPPDYFENSIFGASWKTLSDEELKEKLENAEEAKMAIFLQNLSKEDLDLILSKNTRLHNEYVKYEYVKDENGNLVVDREHTEENGEESECYKVKEEPAIPYYQHLLELDFSKMSISNFSKRTGYYNLAIEEMGGSNIRNVFKISVTVGDKDWSKTQSITTGKEQIRGDSNHFKFKITSQAKTKRGQENGSESDGFDVFVIYGSFTQPPYAILDTYVDNSTGKRMNFHNYTPIVSDGSDSVKDKTINFSKIDNVDFSMCVNAKAAGMASGGAHEKMEIWAIHPDLCISYDTAGGTPTAMEDTIIEYNESGMLATPSLTKTGYNIKSGQQWKRKSDGKIFAAGVNNTARTYKDCTEDEEWPSSLIKEETFIANWVANTYTVTYNGNGATGGSTANSSHTYDVEKALTTNGYTRAYTVTYDYNGNGQSSSSETANYKFNGWATTATGAVAYTNSQSVKNLTTTNGGTVTLYANWSSTSVTLPTPTRTGYMFLGWYDAATGGNRIGSGGASYTPTGNKKLYAHWSPITYYVAYNGNGATGGTMTNSTHTYDEEKSLTRNAYTKSYTLTLEYNGDGVAPTSTTVNWKFDGWATRPTTEKVYDDAEKVINLTTENRATVPLFAKWKSSSIYLPTPTRTGYLFQGWYNAQTGGNKIGDGGASYTTAQNTTLYAHWTPITYYISYNGNGATGGSTETSTHTYDQDKRLTNNGYTRAYTVTYNYNGSGQESNSKTVNYKFVGWATSSTGTKVYEGQQNVRNLTTTNLATVPLYAKWEPISTYLPSPTRTGYLFQGWYDKAIGGNKIGDSWEDYVPTEDITLYAHWEPIIYYVAYDGNGATDGYTAMSMHTYDQDKKLTDNKYTRAYTVSYNRNYTESGQNPNSETANYRFDGWATSSTGEKVYNDEQIVRNLTADNLLTLQFYAHWTPTSVTLPTIERTGYLFQGWYDAATGGNKIGDGGASYIPTENKTIYAHWTPITYYVSYNGNGATGGSTETSTHIYDQYKNLNPNGYTRAYTVTYNYNGNGQTISSDTANYIHNGWATSPTGDKVYNREQSVKNLTTTHLATVPLYAHWTPTSITLPTPTRTGHNFLGWYDEETGGNKIGEGGASYTPTANTTMYAHWEPWTLKVKVNLKDLQTQNIIVNNANFKVYAYNKNTGNYDTFVMDLTQKEDKTYVTNNYLVYSDTNLGKFRIIEETAPYGYYGDWQNQEQTAKNYHDIDIEETIRTKNYLGQTVADKGSITMTIENTRIKAQIETNIIDIETKGIAQADATLEGAVYGIYAKQSIIHADGKTGILYQAGDLVQRKTIENGRLTYDDLELGEYYIKQITPPKGYTKSETMYSINLPYEGEKVQRVTRTQTVEEKVNKQAFQLVKIGNVGGNTEFQFLEGAGFKIYLISSLSKVKNGEIIPDENGNYKAEDFKDYDFTEEKTALDYSKTTQGENIAEIFTDKEGYLLSPEIAYGKYIVVESTVPEERLSIDPFLVTTEEDNRTPKRLRVFFDEEFRAKIQIVKKDATTGKTILKPNTQYRIFNKTTNEYEEQWLTYPTKVLLGTSQNPYTTDETGTMETPLSLAVGEYEIQEVTAPQGYVLEGKEGKSIQGIYTETPKERINFTISNTVVTEYDEDTGDAVLRVAQYNEQQVGSLTINVTGEYLSGYTKDTNNHYNFQYQTRPIEGVEYTIYAKYDIYSQDNQKDIVYQKDEMITSVKSNEQGKVIIDNLPIGSYYVRETKAANGFTLNHEIKDITIEYEGQEKAVVYKDTSYMDQRQKIKIQLINKDVETEKAIPGGKFGLYAKKEIHYRDNEGIVRTIPEGELIAEIEADENGIVKWDEEHRIDLPLGSYEIKQTNAPYGYITNPNSIEINAEYRGQDTKVIEINMEMTNQQSKTIIKIQDEETKNGLAETQMKLLDKNKNVIQEWTTDESGEKDINKLQRGETYILQEVKPRTNYINKMTFGENQNEMTNTENAEIEEITFVVKDVLDLQNIRVENKAKVGNISLEKQGEVLVGIHTDDKGNKNFQYEMKNLAGATYYLYAKENISHPDGHTGNIFVKGEKVAEIVTSMEGAKITKVKEELLENHSQEVQKLLQRGLLLGKYEIEEIQAPEGYYKDIENSKHEIVLEEENNNNEMVIKQERYENIRQKIKIELTNKDKETGEPITGGKFELYAQKEIHYIDQDGNSQIIAANEKIAEVQTDENGIARWDSEQNIDLPLGSYYIKQTEAPYGYVTNNTPIEINGEYKGQDTKVIEINMEMTNQQSKTIIKIQDEETKNGLAETQMKLLDKNKTVIQEWTTDESGERYINKLQRGETYILQEVKPRTNYINKMTFGENQNEMTNTENTEIEEITFVVKDVLDLQNIIVENKAKVGNISLEKQGEVLVGIHTDDKGNKNFQYEMKNLAGATYYLYAKENISHPDGHTGIVLAKGQEVAQITTSTEGAKITNIKEELLTTYSQEVQKLLQRGLLLGKYEIEEIQAPEGYYKDIENSKHEIVLEEENNNNEIVIKQERYENIRQKIKIELTNKDKETGEPITGGKFELYAQKEIHYIDQDGNSQIIVANEKISEVQTDENGIARWDSEQNIDLPLGSYYIKQTEAPYGYVTNNTPIEINGEYRGQDTKVIEINMEMTNQQSKTIIKIQDEETKNGLAETQMKLLDKNKAVIQEWTTDESGEKYISKLQRGETYILQEIKPRANYEAKMIIGENQNEMANVENAEITFVVKDGEEQQNIIVGNRAKVGNISLLKQGEVLVGVENEEEGNKKFQYELQNLAGAEYNVYVKEDITHPDGQTGVILKAGTPIAQVTTAIEGIKITKIEESLINDYPEEVQKLLQRGLPLGTYEMEEIKAPKGYYRDLENCKQEVKVEDNGNQEVVNKEVSIKNERQMLITKDPETPTPPVDPDNPDTPEKDKIGIFKQDEETKEAIQGVEIGIYVAEDIKENDKIILAKDELVEKAITNEKGQIQLKHNLPLGKYYVQEIRTSKGYAYKEEKIAVEHENLEETTKNVNLYVEITNKATEVDIIKTDKEKNPVPGAKLQLQDEEGNVIDEWESTDEKHKITKLETEKIYKIVEIQPVKGYVTAKEVTFSLDKYGTIVTEEENQYDETTVMIKGEKTKITITVVDEETEEKIEGAHIQIIHKETGEVVYEMETTKEEVIIEGLPIGEYEVIQTTNSGGYVTTKTPITVEDKEGIQEKILKQEITKLFIEIKDNEENTDMEATKIEIKDKETGKVIASTEVPENEEEAEEIIKIEKVDGGYIVKRLEPKEYEIETTLPDGYKKIENANVTIQDTSELQKIKLETRKLILDMQVKKYLNNIFVNGKTQNINKESMNKIEVHRKAVEQTQIKLEYIVEVSNIGEIAGNIAKIIEQLPEGTTFEKESSDSNWEMEGNNLVIKEFADKELGVGESKQYKIVAKWNNQQDNFGSKVNTAFIEGIGNKLNYKEKTDGQESNIAKVVTLFSIATGENMKLILEVMDIAIFWMISIGILIIIEIKMLGKKNNKKRD